MSRQMSNEYVGYLLVLLALLCDGSYGAFAKLEQVSRLHLLALYGPQDSR